MLDEEEAVYDDSTRKLSKALLAYSIDPLSTGMDFYLRYGVLENMTVGGDFTIKEGRYHELAWGLHVRGIIVTGDVLIEDGGHLDMFTTTTSGYGQTQYGDVSFGSLTIESGGIFDAPSDSGWCSVQSSTTYNINMFY